MAGVPKLDLITATAMPRSQSRRWHFLSRFAPMRRTPPSSLARKFRRRRSFRGLRKRLGVRKG
jgi:hypothetical protein